MANAWFAGETGRSMSIPINTTTCDPGLSVQSGLYLSVIAEGISWRSLISVRWRAVPVARVRQRDGEACSPRWIGSWYLLQSFT